jgi:hypothetical protein
MAAELACTVNGQGDVWVWDSGASKHITGHIEDIVNPKPVQGDTTITFGNSQEGKAQAVGVSGPIGTAIRRVQSHSAHLSHRPSGTTGDVILLDTCNADRKLVLRDVLYVPEAKTARMISMSHARKVGARFVIDEDGCKVYYGPDLLVTAKERNGLYITENRAARPAVPTTAAMFAQPKETPQEWHRRFGHLGYDNLAKLVKTNMVKGINVSAEDFLEANKEMYVDR